MYIVVVMTPVPQVNECETRLIAMQKFNEMHDKYDGYGLQIYIADVERTAQED